MRWGNICLFMVRLVASLDEVDVCTNARFTRGVEVKVEAEVKADKRTHIVRFNSGRVIVPV
jgi:hypothetical protein